MPLELGQLSFATKYIKDAFQRFSIEQKHAVVCGRDDCRANADWRCVDCKQNYCEACRLLHNSFNILKPHKFYSLIEFLGSAVDEWINCEVHRTKELEFYCNECSEMICISCHLTHHQSHDILSIEEELGYVMPEIRSFRNQLSQQCLGSNTFQHRKQHDVELLSLQLKVLRFTDLCLSTFLGTSLLLVVHSYIYDAVLQVLSSRPVSKEK